MRRTALVSGVVAFAMAFLGNGAASMLAVPMLVEAQEARLRFELQLPGGAEEPLAGLVHVIGADDAEYPTGRRCYPPV